ncbi:carboxypeptidase-like regulatory domain-containing protein [bacterium]|nr:carboxypeptidase-like regulatory domain-containing protein [bacterium]
MNNASHTILNLIIMMTTVFTLSAARLAGTVVDPSGQPIAGAAFSVRFNNDINTDTLHYTDFDGHYDFFVTDGPNEFKISKNGYNSLEFNIDVNDDIIGSTFTLQINEEEQAMLLEEVKVTAKMLEQFTNRTEMYLTKENRDFGINALDAVSSLPLFQSRINGTQLTNLTGSSVNILINGHRASPEELQNLTGYNIKKVVYYENAPAKFAPFFSGPVINIILNKVTRIEFRGNIGAQAANTWSGSGNLGATLLMPEHYLNGAFNIGGQHTDRSISRETFSYPGLTDSFMADQGTIRNLNTRTFLSYQWDRGPQMLSANFTYVSNSGRIFNPMDILESSDEMEVRGIRTSGSHRITDMMNLDLYYTYQFKGGQELSFDLANAYNKARRSTYQIQTMGEGSAYGDFLNDNDTHNTVYQLDASAMFSSPLWGGSISCSLNENYRRLSQYYVNNFFPDLPSNIRNNASTMFAIANYERTFGRFGMDLSLSLFWSEMTLSEGGKQRQTNPYPRFTFSYNANNYITLRLMGWVESSQNSIGQMNMNRQFIDTRYFAENLPYEKQVFKYSLSFSPFISIPSAKLYIMPGVRYHYTRHPYVSYIFAEEENFIKRSLVIPFTNELYYSLGLSWKPLAGLDINPYFSGKYLAYRTPAGPVRFNWNDLRIYASYMTGPFQFAVQCTTPSKTMDGVQTFHNGWSAVLNALWRKGSWYVGVMCSFDEDARWSLTEIPGFSYYSTSRTPRQGWGLAIFAGYSFKAGKDVSTRRKNKRLSGNTSETGFSSN